LTHVASTPFFFRTVGRNPLRWTPYV
jgi:hypothetical protein